MDALDRLERASGERQLWRTFSDVLSEAGFAFYIAAYKLGGQQYRHWTNLPAGQYPGPQDDPFLKYCCAYHEPTLTGPEFAGDYTYLSQGDREFIRQSARSRMISGIGIPVRLKHRARYGGFNIGTSLTQQQFKTLLSGKEDWLRSLCLVAHARIEDLGVLDRSAGAADTLTARERDVFALLVEGASRQEIADRLGISLHTVGTHIKTVYRKLDISSQAEAVRLAVSGG